MEKIKVSRRDLFIDMVVDKFIFKNSQITLFQVQILFMFKSPL